MNLVKGYVVSDEALESWMGKFVPDFDFFYFEKEPSYLEVKRREKVEKTHFTLDNLTSFCTWQVKESALYLGIVSNEVFLRLKKDQQEEVIKGQWQLGREMVFIESDFMSLLVGLGEEKQIETLKIVKEISYFESELEATVILLQGHSWKRISREARITILLNYADLWVKEHALQNEVNLSDFSVISSYINTFSSINGPNCLAAVASCVKKDLSHISKWMHQEEFSTILEEEKFVRVNGEGMKRDDVLIWKNENGSIVHSAFVLDEKYSFNKHGQTMYNPWQLLEIKDVMGAWEQDGFQYEVYRRM